MASDIKSLLLRVFFESADGGYYSPMFDECYEVLPIPEVIGRATDVDHARKFAYSLIPCRCEPCFLSKYLPNDYLFVGGSSYSIAKIVAHWDPRLDIGCYVDYWRNVGGRIPGNFRECEDCYIFFAAGLAKYPRGYFEVKRGFTEIRRTFLSSDRGIYVVGYMKVDTVVDLAEISAELNLKNVEYSIRDVWHEAAKKYGDKVLMNPHYARPADLPVVMLSNEGNYGFFKEPLPLIEWKHGKKMFSKYAYAFGIRTFDDRVRHKAFNLDETKEILKLLRHEGVVRI